jgi:hypothetical protein
MSCTFFDLQADSPFLAQIRAAGCLAAPSQKALWTGKTGFRFSLIAAMPSFSSGPVKA